MITNSAKRKQNSRVKAHKRREDRREGKNALRSYLDDVDDVDAAAQCRESHFSDKKSQGQDNR